MSHSKNCINKPYLMNVLHGKVHPNIISCRMELKWREEITKIYICLKMIYMRLNMDGHSMHYLEKHYVVLPQISSNE